jgi:hypothetical protein
MQLPLFQLALDIRIPKLGELLARLGSGGGDVLTSPSGDDGNDRVRFRRGVRPRRRGRRGLLVRRCSGALVAMAPPRQVMSTLGNEGEVLGLLLSR